MVLLLICKLCWLWLCDLRLHGHAGEYLSDIVYCIFDLYPVVDVLVFKDRKVQFDGPRNWLGGFGIAHICRSNI